MADIEERCRLFSGVLAQNDKDIRVTTHDLRPLLLLERGTTASDAHSRLMHPKALDLAIQH